jgi:hypothetical protein
MNPLWKALSGLETPPWPRVYSPSTGITGVWDKLPDDTRIIEELALTDDGRDKSTAKTLWLPRRTVWPG